MKRSEHDLEKLPGGFRSLWRTFSLGYRAEPRLLTISLGLALFMMVPDALLALWLKIGFEGELNGKDVSAEEHNSIRFKKRLGSTEFYVERQQMRLLLEGDPAYAPLLAAEAEGVGQPLIVP